MRSRKQTRKEKEKNGTKVPVLSAYARKQGRKVMEVTLSNSAPVETAPIVVENVRTLSGKGTITRCTRKGWGFITSEDNQSIHFLNQQLSFFPRMGMEVTFVAEQGKRGWRASFVSPV